jgi:hypothetical protein
MSQSAASNWLPRSASNPSARSPLDRVFRRGCFSNKADREHSPMM